MVSAPNGILITRVATSDSWIGSGVSLLTFQLGQRRVTGYS